LPAPVDLRSDTVTQPTPAMKRAMVDAPLGDDVFGDDPSVNRLEAMAAERLGKEAAIFVPSGTMANQVAVRCHTSPGDLVIMAEASHVYQYEGGAPAMISGVLIRLLPAERGILEPAAVRDAIPPDDVHFAPARLLCVENTSNRGGGSVYPLERLDALGALARECGLVSHLDGARIFNAQVASGVPVARIAQPFDTVSVCLSKGLGAPVGSMLCGSAALIRRARRVRKQLGGGMRQAGILAAAGIHALEFHVERLAEDHARARQLWQGLATAGWQVEPEPETNMVYVRVEDQLGMVARLAEAGLLCAAVGPGRIRLVTHLGLDDAAVARALSIFASIAR
jgi:threonine aldolase